MAATPSLDTIFNAAIDIASAEERAAYVAGACGGDAALRGRVEQLLAAHFRAGTFLERPAAAGDLVPPTGPAPPSAAPPERPGAVIGPYKLLQQIGEGGMGAVFMAEQARPVQRRVALKIIKPGMDSAQVLARFEAERQALALMDHPNIAKVLDAGATESGRPYFVMELVKGVPLTKYCDERRLTPRERLALFVPVCQAVQHAHQKGVIHRDLKPSNVLVALYDGAPVPKVIDFGVAKATGPKLTERTLFTEFGAVVGTPEYMSPEQAELNQLDIDTRSDVYALGVLLYELLTGTTPLSRKRLKEAALLEVLRIIREEEPPKPSTRLSTAEELPLVAANRGVDPGKLSRLVRGELDWIVMKALEKDRRRRYETANGLAEDIGRYLRDEPVLACPPSAGYRLGKFVRRNKRPLAALALAGAALGVAAVALAVSYVQTSRALTDRNDAYGVLETEKGNAERAYHSEAAAKKRLGRALKNEQHALAIYGVSLADREWQAGHSDKAERALDDCPPDNRHWEWHLLKRLCNQDLHRVQFPVKDSWIGTKPAAFSPDGRLFAAYADGAANGGKVWDARTGREVVALVGSARGAALAFSPDGKRVVANAPPGANAGPALWDVATGQRLVGLTRNPPRGGVLADAAFSPAGGRLVGTPSGGGTPALYDTATGREVRALRPPPAAGQAKRAAFHPDGRHVAVAVQRPDPDLPGALLGEVRVFDADTGHAVRTLSGGHRMFRVRDKDRPVTVDEEGETSPVADVIPALCYSPDGALLATAGADKAVVLWDAGTGQPARRLLGHEGLVSAVCFSPDGRLLASAGLDRTVRLWEADSGRQLAVHRGHCGWVHTLAFTDGGARLVSASADGTLRTWAAAPSGPTLALAAKVSHAVFSPAGDALATAATAPRPDRKSGTDVRLWETGTFREVWVRELPAMNLTRVRFGDGRWLALVHSAPGSYAVVDVEARREVGRLSTNGLILSPDWGRTVATGVASWDEQAQGKTADIEVRDTAADRVVAALGRHEAGSRVLLHPAGRGQIVFSPHRAPRVYDAAGRETGTLDCPPGVSGTAVFSPDGYHLAVASGLANQPGELRQWDLRTGKEVGSFDGHPVGVNALCFSPDGRLLVTGGVDRAVKVWDTRTGREFLTLRGHTAAIRQVAFSPDGRLLVSVATDGTALVWDGRPWQDTPGRVIDLSGGFRGSRKAAGEAPDPDPPPPPDGAGPAPASTVATPGGSLTRRKGPARRGPGTSGFSPGRVSRTGPETRTVTGEASAGG